MKKHTKGFSKLSKSEKIDFLYTECLNSSEKDLEVLNSHMYGDVNIQKLYDEFSENTVSNFYMPFGIAPNFLINDKLYTIPMVIEESSVVASASKTANFWLDKGGFKAEVLSTEKIGHVHFIYRGDGDKLRKFFRLELKEKLLDSVSHLTEAMRSRGGGIMDINLIDKSLEEENYFQIEATFQTVDSMGANFINSCLELFAEKLKNIISQADHFSSEEKDLEVIMSILSNYTPKCIVRAHVECRVEELTDSIGSSDFADKFVKAVRIAKAEPYRATTHNKGIFNGIDAVVIATGNDFRAVEACGHSYASRNGKYTSLSDVSIENGIFRFWLDLPISVGTVGGLTDLHPMAKLSHKILGNPNAKELMCIIAVAGLAQNFAALRALVTTGIQKGHMKVHLLNILNRLGATDKEKVYFVDYFKDKTVSHYEVVKLFNSVKAV
ncbi:hydroxymethylglutaryl-CoA reductase, degradative [Ichthyobacterium seriolicida]|uniref:3-hydroxy-3-methylglutaryl coenzyme A reductase n=1 Tax=Ichthyobacterium seriolicida TaxID=242600 RepID=A0A1J1DWU3_9FLAO|nr:hydroxymethylglutaryl-CoA reductase, degradative [Ichthyobacterium seriolicida]BAV94327.1 hydroxymethylglutaryl-CoA reductase [Ichthyobacterium seriolicida]